MRLMTVLFSAVALAMASPSPAQQTETELSILDNGFSLNGWEAVGRLDLGQKGFCTGALISPRMVLTAAHCLFDKTTGARIEDSEIVFRAGWRNGIAAAEGRVLNSAVHPRYAFSDAVRLENVAADLALLELIHPITTRGVTPFEVLAEPAHGTPVAVVSYGHSRSEAPAFQESCNVLGRDRSGMMMLSCSVEFGSSGAPVFTLANGRAQIVSVISAKSEDLTSSEEVSLSVGLGPRLDEVREVLDASRERFVRAPAQDAEAQAPTSGPRILQGGGSARFIRP